jgi:nucleotide-binding universal stress UspA family protein
MYNNILIGYDDSRYSMAAVKEVAAWLKKHGGKAELLHSVYFDEEEFYNKPEILEQRISAGRESCNKARDIAAGFGVSMDIKVSKGEPPKLIRDTARSEAVDLIALGTHGRRGISRMIMGSVTAEVLVDAPCDVLVVKRPCESCTGGYSKILVPFDASASSIKALERACMLAANDQAEITVCYIIPRYEEMLNFLKTESIRAALREEARKILEQAGKIAARKGITIKTVVGDGHPAENIVAQAAQDPSDLIVMGSYGWSGINKSIIGSTAERVIMEAECPILITR